MQTSKIGIAMSGGVDSTAAALLLKERFGGDRLRGFFMRLPQPDVATRIARVHEIARRLHLPLEVIDLTTAFDSEVLTYFTASYVDGLTPNPCVVCNHRIKFGLFLDAMLAAGVEQVATGHYARLDHGTPNRLFTAVDSHKDQSYFLARLSQKQLAHSLFPLGEIEKSAVYDYVESRGFTDFRGRESQDVCFLEQSTAADFVTSRHNEASTPGAIVDLTGSKLGDHRGIHHYTVGQRRGLGLSSPKPLYVVELDAGHNRVVVGDSTALFKRELHLARLHWLSGSGEEGEFTAKIRSTHEGATASIRLRKDERALLTFAEPQRAVTPGQFAVLYRGDEVIGSGIITADRNGR